MSSGFGDVQRLVLVGQHWRLAQHLVLHFGRSAQPRFFLNQLLKCHAPTPESDSTPQLQLSLGFSRRGLERLPVPDHVLACLAEKAPAFSAGAALRAASHLGLGGEDSPTRWDPPFGLQTMDAVLSLHAMAPELLAKRLVDVEVIARDSQVQVSALPLAERLPAPDDHQLVHFGYRDSLSRVGIIGYTKPAEMTQCLPVSRFAAGEFVLGHAQQSGAMPWTASGGRRVWPQALRGFFRNGSFGALQQIEQYVAVFEDFVAEASRRTKFEPQEIKAKLCGRGVDGSPLAQHGSQDPEADFDYAQDPQGLRCPFGSHVRRMNPRTPDPATALAHAVRVRPLLRRGMPYGAPWDPAQPGPQRGLMGHFFCASLEDQFEHLLAQWAERVPLGSPDGGGARDPLIGAHEPGDGGFEIPLPGGRPLVLHGLRRFTRTRGLAYLFYPGLDTLGRMARSEVFLDTRGDDE